MGENFWDFCVGDPNKWGVFNNFRECQRVHKSRIKLLLAKLPGWFVFVLKPDHRNLEAVSLGRAWRY